jgi:hypothetical protein
MVRAFLLSLLLASSAFAQNIVSQPLGGNATALGGVTPSAFTLTLIDDTSATNWINTLGGSSGLWQDAQVSNTLTLAGGSINNVPIGATTASTGRFSTLLSAANVSAGSLALFDATGGDYGSAVLDNGVYTFNNIAGSATTISAGEYQFPSKTRLTAPSDGILLMTNAASSNFLRLQFGGTTASFPAIRRNSTSVEVVLADNSAYAGLGTGALTANGNIQLGNAGDAFYWNARSQIRSGANGNIHLMNAAATDFGLLQFGGTSSSFPALKRSTNTLQVRLADDSGDATIKASALTTAKLKAGGMLTGFPDLTAVGGSGTGSGPVTLKTITLAASTLTTDGDTVIFEGGGTTATGEFIFQFAGTDIGFSRAMDNSHWAFRVRITRLSSSTAMVDASVTLGGGGGPGGTWDSVISVVSGITWTNANNLLFVVDPSGVGYDLATWQMSHVVARYMPAY